MSTTPLTTAACERKHLLGQDLKPRKRGKAVSCRTLQQKTHQKSVKLAATRVRKRALAAVVGDCAQSQRRFGQQLTKLKIGHSTRYSRNRATDEVKSVAKALPGVLQEIKPKRLRAYDAYITDKFSSSDHVDGETTFQRRSRFVRKWGTMTAVERSPYVAIEAAQAAAPVEDLWKRRDENRTRNKQRCCSVLNTFEDVVQHEVFTGCLGLQTYESGLRPDLVIADKTDAEIMAMSREIFKYDSTPVLNPRHKMQAFVPCKIRYGGLCGKDDLLRETRMLTLNLYHKFQKMKAALPKLVGFRVQGCGLEQ